MISVDILRTDERCDCTNHGVTHPANAHGKRFYIIHDSEAAKLKALEDLKKYPNHVHLVLKVKHIGSPYYYVTPLVHKGGREPHYMMGGNFIYSCGSDFRQDFHQYPLPVHDRTE